MMSNRLISKCIWNDIKKDSPLIILMAVIELFAMPLAILTQKMNEYGSYSRVSNITDIPSDWVKIYPKGTVSDYNAYIENLENYEVWELFIGFVSPGFIVLMIFAFVFGFFKFSFLHKKKEVDFYHSLPQSRITIFTTRFVTGVVGFAVPYIIMHALTLFIANVAFPLTAGVGVANARTIAGCFYGLLFAIMAYALTVLAMMLTGTNFIGICLTILFNCFFPLIAFIMMMIYEKKLYLSYYVPDDSQKLDLFEAFIQRLSGINIFSQISNVYEGYFISNLPYELIPFYNYNRGNDYYRNNVVEYKLFPFVTPSHILFTVLLIVLCLVAYKKLKLERCGEAFQFKWIEGVITTIMSIIAGIIVSFIFSEISESVAIAIVSGLGVVLAHSIFEFISTRDIKQIFRNKIRLIVCTLLVVILTIYVYS